MRAAVPTAVPESEIPRVEFDALLRIDMFPFAAPPVCGKKATLKVALWPGAKVSGRLSPLTPKPEPETVAWVMVTLEPPELVSVSGKVWLFPTGTLPKLRLEELAARAPAVTAVAESETPSEELEALLATESIPVAEPLACGAKLTLKVWL